MAYVRFHGGTVASNNLRDVKNYCIEHNLPLMTVRAIVARAVLDSKSLSIGEAEDFWSSMLAKGRRLPNATAQEAIDYYRTLSGAETVRQRT